MKMNAFVSEIQKLSPRKQHLVSHVVLTSAFFPWLCAFGS